MSILMAMPSGGVFAWILSVLYGKKEFALELKTFYDFPYFLMHIRPFYMISNYNKTGFCIYMFKVDTKNTRTRHEVCLKLKLKIHHNNIVKQCSVGFTVEFEHISFQVLVLLLLTFRI